MYAEERIYDDPRDGAEGRGVMVKTKVKKQKGTSKSTALGIVKRYFPNVTKVIDATESLDISVSKRDCDSASSKMPDECAVAKAVQRHHTGAIISSATSYVIDGHTATRFKTPIAITKELVSFDRNHEFHPGEYSLRAPAQSERLGPRNRPQPVKNRGHKRRRVHHMTGGIRSLSSKSVKRRKS